VANLQLPVMSPSVGNCMEGCLMVIRRSVMYTTSASQSTSVSSESDTIMCNMIVFIITIIVHAYPHR